jgi:hypothetical protein
LSRDCARGVFISCVLIAALAIASTALAAEHNALGIDESPLANYQAYEPQEIADWVEQNQRTNRIGGWRAYARESQAAPSAVDKSESQAAQSAVDKSESQAAQSAVDKSESEAAQSAVDKGESDAAAPDPHTEHESTEPPMQSKDSFLPFRSSRDSQ